MNSAGRPQPLSTHATNRVYARRVQQGRHHHLLQARTRPQEGQRVEVQLELAEMEEEDGRDQEWLVSAPILHTSGTHHHHHHHQHPRQEQMLSQETSNQSQYPSFQLPAASSTKQSTTSSSSPVVPYHQLPLPPLPLLPGYHFRSLDDVNHHCLAVAVFLVAQAAAR